MSQSSEGMSAGPRRCPSSAFTLVELLVIVAIIAILLSLMAPTMSRVVQLANLNKCSSNMNQIGKAVAAYAAENKSWVPRDAMTASQVGHYQFAAVLVPYLDTGRDRPEKPQDWNYVYEYLKGVDVLLCPEVTDNYAPGTNEDGYVLNYVNNSCDFYYYKKHGNYSNVAAPPCRVLTLPASPSEVLYIAEFNPNYGMGPKGFTAYDVWLPHLMPFNKLAPNSNPRMIHAEDDRHQGRTTIVFFDGHADTYRQDPYEIKVSMMNPFDERYDP